jgi:hypothetical protein
VARQVLPVVGAVVGAFFGNPQLGWAIGSIIGNAVDPQVIKGPSIGEIAQQTSAEGGPRPIVFALSQPMAGNVIASGPPRIVKKSSGGKGGPKVQTESVYRTYAIGVCEGEASFVRIWRNNQLVYDASDDPQVSEEDNAAFLENARFFDGTFTQNASPDLEAIFGVGTTPAHRGTAYMVMADEDLTDLRGAIPQWMFQMQSCEINIVPFIEFVARPDPGDVGLHAGYGIAGDFIGAFSFGDLIDKTTINGFEIAKVKSRNNATPSTQDDFQVILVGSAGNYPAPDEFTYCDVYKNDVLVWRFESPVTGIDPGNLGITYYNFSLPLGTHLMLDGDLIRVEFFFDPSPGPFP